MRALATLYDNTKDIFFITMEDRILFYEWSKEIYNFLLKICFSFDHDWNKMRRSIGLNQSSFYVMSIEGIKNKFDQ